MCGVCVCSRVFVCVCVYVYVYVYVCMYVCMYVCLEGACHVACWFNENSCLVCKQMQMFERLIFFFFAFFDDAL